MLNEFIEGRYKVEREVGRGGMGVVLRAFDTHLNRLVALKMLPSNTTHDSELHRRLAAEARAASALSHPSIATVYDYVERRARRALLSMSTWKAAPGAKSLRSPVSTTEEILDASAQLADALAAAHKITGLSIETSNPKNIMSVPDADYSRGRVKILDFGLAKPHPPRTAVVRRTERGGDSFHCYEPRPADRGRELYGPGATGRAAGGRAHRYLRSWPGPL